MLAEKKTGQSSKRFGSVAALSFKGVGQAKSALSVGGKWLSMESG